GDIYHLNGAEGDCNAPYQTASIGEGPHMPELTHLDEKLAEVLGLAQAAEVATKKVATLARKEKETELVELMKKMSEQASQVADRCERAASTRNGMKTAINAKARETKPEVT